MNLIFDTGPMLNQLKIIRTICSFSLSPYLFNLIFELFDLKRVCMKCCKFRFSLLYAKEDPKRPNIISGTETNLETCLGPAYLRIQRLHILRVFWVSFQT